MDRYEITKAGEPKPTNTGKEFTIVDLVLDGSSSHYENVKVWRGHPEYANIEEGGFITGKLKSDPQYGYSLGDGKYQKKTFTKPTSQYQAPQSQTTAQSTRQTNQFIDRKAEHIKEAQERKDLSIAYFNSVNGAVNIIEKLITEKTLPPFSDKEDIKREIITWRDWLLAEFMKYSAAPVDTKTLPFASPNVVDIKDDVDF